MKAPERIKHKETTWKMFNTIAHRYDLANRCLSLGIDTRWRAKVASFMPKTAFSLLDLGTGTGDFALSLIRRLGSDRFTFVVCSDLAEKMLDIAKEKVKRLSLSSLVDIQLGDATKTKFHDNSFDVITMSFAIRNVTDHCLVLSEMVRVLTPGGSAFILEFSLPRNPIIRAGYLFYFRYILPLLGGLISGSRESYRYLNKSVEAFPYGDDFLADMKQCGFDSVEAIELTFGIATLYIGRKA